MYSYFSVEKRLECMGTQVLSVLLSVCGMFSLEKMSLYRDTASACYWRGMFPVDCNVRVNNRRTTPTERTVERESILFRTAGRSGGRPLDGKIDALTEQNGFFLHLKRCFHPILQPSQREKNIVASREAGDFYFCFPCGGDDCSIGT